ncbi:response regulator transcription factor [Dehalococcoides sp. THU3]|uniref:response regulator transcription factor n=1 Tax=Dehalococcoides TaxID=61434 RepID=UPI0032183F7A
MKILVIEDDKDIVKTVEILCHVRWPEAQITHASKGLDGIKEVENITPDVILLDLGLPDIDGINVIKQIRSFSNIPIIIITVRSDENDIFTALEAGADDYLVKPFGRLEIIARIQAVYRRKMDAYFTSPCSYGDLKYSPSTNILYCEGKDIYLTRLEGIAVRELICKAGDIVSLERMAEVIWGEAIESSDESIRLIIHRLRKKIKNGFSKSNMIMTKIGVGYYLSDTA